jgi:hypothetical protein
MNRLLNPIFATLLGSVLATPALAMDPACQPVADANAKMLATPTHITSTTTAAYAGVQTGCSRCARRHEEYSYWHADFQSR